MQSGLQEGERIVLEGLQKVRVGSVVSIAEESEAQPVEAKTQLVEPQAQPADNKTQPAPSVVE